MIPLGKQLYSLCPKKRIMQCKHNIKLKQHKILLIHISSLYLCEASQNLDFPIKAYLRFSTLKESHLAVKIAWA